MVQKRVLTCVNFKIYQVIIDNHNTDPLRSHIQIHKPTQERDLLNTFQIPTTTFVRFMLSVEDSYRENPYHNSFHAADVTQVWPKNGIEAIMCMRKCPFSFLPVDSRPAQFA